MVCTFKSVALVLIAAYLKLSTTLQSPQGLGFPDATDRIRTCVCSSGIPMELPSTRLDDGSGLWMLDHEGESNPVTPTIHQHPAQHIGTSFSQ